MINTLNEDRESNFLIICDHASNHIPSKYNNLGLDKEVLDTHIAYDIGIKEVACYISNSLQCPLVMSDFSRLLIDANRGIDDPTLIMKISDGRKIKGNKNISFLFNCDEKRKRINSYYNIYHEKISDIIKQSIKREVFPAIISLHSFTPLWKHKKRLIELGILWDSDDRVPNIFFNYFMKHQNKLVIGNNKPYSGRMKNDTLYRHGTKQGLPNALIEIRQDLISNEKGQEYFAKIITKPLIQIKNNSNLFQKRIYKSLAI
jgi:predicted N-formylglutamate amidohydrolase|tara:strand:+ start:1440 stop:2219 length:780 start_codon:yes stop_codon:yes gene_type:complete